MIAAAMKAQEGQHGKVGRNLTSHWTGAEIAWMSFARWDASLNSSRPVNSGVRFLLNAVAQNIESAILNFTEAEDFLNAHAA
jgi:hypothetical protein